MAILYDTPVIPSEYTSPVTQTSDTVTFNNLNPNYGYEIFYVSPDTEVNDLTIPKWTNVSKTISGDYMSLTYTISGGISGSSQFALKISAV